MRGVLKKTAIVLFFIIGLFMVFAISANIYSGVKNARTAEKGNERLSTQTEMPLPVRTAEKSREDMLEDSLKSVVGISGATNSPAADVSVETQWYMGSGVLATDDGYIITNHHVIGARPQRILVTLYNGETIDGKTVWSDRALDLAIVKISGTKYSAATLGDAQKLRVGEDVNAIGNPLSMQFQRTVTAGIVSALGRSISVKNEDGTSNYMEDLIQTDASINPGNSGGPLINSRGEVVGINTVKVSTAEGMGFAVPVNVCIPVIERLKNVGEFHTPYLGLYAYTAKAARYLELNDDFSEGLFAAKIDDGGPAFSAGLRYGDIITAVGNVTVNTMLDLRQELYKRQAGETVEVEFVRDGTRRRVDIMLGEKD